nr:unnamed protein product [Digitaria exilis]
MPSPPPSPRPVGDPSRRPQREICVIPRSTAIDQREALLSANALVAMVGGPRPPISTAQVASYLQQFHGVQPEGLLVHHATPDDFLVVFASAASATAVLHSPPPVGAPFQLIWRRWRRQARASLATLRFRVLVELRGIPDHARNLDTAQRILNPACAELVEPPPELAGDDRGFLYAAAWCVHPDLIPVTKLLLIPEPREPHVPGNLFLREEEIIQSKMDGLWYRVAVRIIEVHDWDPDDSSDDGTPPDRYNSSEEDDDYPGSSRQPRSGPWPKTTKFGNADGERTAPVVLGPGWGGPFAAAAGNGGTAATLIRFGSGWGLRSASFKGKPLARRVAMLAQSLGLLRGVRVTSTMLLHFALLQYQPCVTRSSRSKWTPCCMRRPIA